MKRYDEIQQLIAEGKKRDERAKQVRAEQLTRSIEAENLLTQKGLQIVEFLNSKKSDLIGKKLFLSDGSISKFFAPIIKDQLECSGIVFCAYFSRGGEWLNLRANISGGSYDDRTYYCEYFDRTVYNVMKFDNEGKLTDIIEPEKVFNTVFNADFVNSTLEQIRTLQKQVKELEAKISDTKSVVDHKFLNFV